MYGSCDAGRLAGTLPVVMSVFRFKQFSVSHQTAFKVGTDAVLLGALTPVTVATKRALDIGTGSSVIALMLLQRGISSAVGIEIDEAAAAEATENAQKSAWSEQLQIVCADFCNMNVISELGLFDLIVSNPPFFSNALKSPDNKRNTTRHNDESLPLDMLLKNVVSLLSENGFFSLILPVPEAELFRKKAASYELFPIEIHHIFSKPQKPESRQILVLQKQHFPQPPTEKSINIYQADGTYSEEYKRVTKEFYLSELLLLR
jgi:tRNA1Val (adenine37-N6)-methyltransferase